MAMPDLPGIHVSDAARVTLMDLVQAVLSVGFAAAAIYLVVKGQPVPGDLWTLTVGIVSYYLGKRVTPVSGQADR